MNGDCIFHLLRVAMEQEASISPEAREKLQALTMQDMELLADHRRRIFTISLCEDELDRALRRVELARRRDLLVRTYIRCGASTAMMKTLFGMNREDTACLRSQLGVPSQGGRPCKPLPYEASQIWTLWCSSRQMDERDRFLHVAKRMDLPLPIVWNEIKSRTLGEKRSRGGGRRESYPRGSS